MVPLKPDLQVGITPAYAGNTGKGCNGCIGPKDHPRLRGEHGLKRWIECNIMGSPPPTRGTLCQCDCGKIVSGITPAYAGNTVEE